MRELVCDVMDCDGLVVSSFSEDDGLIRCVYAAVEGRKIDPAGLPPVTLAPEGSGMQSTVIRSGEPLRIDDVEERVRKVSQVLYHVDPQGTVHDKAVEGQPQTRSILMIPIKLENRVLGIVQLMSHRRAAYTDEHLEILEGLTLQMAAAGRNAWLYQKAQAEIAERRKAEAALTEAHRRKDEFLAMLAHELRNPLAPLRYAVQIMKEDPDPAVKPRVIDIIDRQVTHMTRLVDDLLDMSWISRRKYQMRKDLIDLVELVRKEALDFRRTLEVDGISFELELPDRPLWVRGDRTRLSQVLWNMLHNANKFSEPGGLVSVSLAASWDDLSVSLVVEDTGIGIEPEILEVIFETFTQGDRSLHRSRGGLGLGLALVKGLVELHEGCVEAFSEGPGHGARFTITLPLAEPPLAEETEVPTVRKRGAPRRILIIEDNEDAAESLRMLLDLTGHTVAVAHSGPEGVETARQFNPEVVLCDIGLPGGMNGYDVARVMRQDPVLRDVGLVALTGYGQEEDQALAREAGFDRHIVKPVDPVYLERMLAGGRDGVTGGR